MNIYPYIISLFSIFINFAWSSKIFEYQETNSQSSTRYDPDRGLYYVEDNKPIKSLDEIERYQDIVPDNIKMVENAAEAGSTKFQFLLGQYYQQLHSVDSIKWHQMAAQNDHVEAQVSLAKIYEHGVFDQANKKQAFYWYNRAAKNDHVVSMYWLSQHFLNKNTSEKDMKSMYEWYLKAANKGYFQAQFDLGMMYAKGDKIKQNDDEALKWFKKSALTQHSISQFNIAAIYERRQDYKQALEWYIQSIIHGYHPALKHIEQLVQSKEKENKEALYFLAKTYLEGQIIPKNLPMAVKNFVASAKLGHLEAQYQIVSFFLENDSKPDEVDSQQLISWLFQVAENKPEIQYEVSKILYIGKSGSDWHIKKDEASALSFLKKSADANYTKALYKLAKLNDTSDLSSLKNPDQLSFVEYYRKAADGGSSKAQFIMGVLYKIGRFIEQNNLIAYDWFNEAAEQGLAEAQYILGCIYQSNINEQNNKNNMIKCFTDAAKQGLKEAQFELSVLYENNPELFSAEENKLRKHLKAAKLCQLAAQQGHKFATEAYEFLYGEMDTDVDANSLIENEFKESYKSNRFVEKYFSFYLQSTF